MAPPLPLRAARPIDRVAVVPICRGVNEEKDRTEDRDEVERFCERMRHEQFDPGIQMHGGGRYSNPFLPRLQPGFTAHDSSFVSSIGVDEVYTAARELLQTTRLPARL